LSSALGATAAATAWGSDDLGENAKTSDEEMAHLGGVSLPV